jgi:hypothetical protein
MAKISAHKIKRYGDNGSPCLQPHSISWDFLLSVLKFFNFGESIINWVKVFYNNISSAVIQGGNFSEFFQIGRGCRQGDHVVFFCKL